MKGKPTWKPMGLTAHKWHEGGQPRDGGNVSASSHVPRRERIRRKTAARWPLVPEKTS